MTVRRKFTPSTILALAALLSGSVIGETQQTRKIVRIGVLCMGSCASPLYKSFRQGMRDLGYVEGHNIVIEERSMEGRRERLPLLVADLVRLNVEVILAGGNAQLPQAIKDATKTTPIVFVISEDPVSSDLVTSFARPGGNITGLANMNIELEGKRVELLRETMPKVTRVAALFNSLAPSRAAIWEVIEATARSLNLHLQRVDVRGGKGVFSPADRL